MKPLANRLRLALSNNTLCREITFSPEAAEKWKDGYYDLSDAKPGLYGSIVARGEAHTLRLALIYALLAESRQIEPSHLSAALAVWRYCEASVHYDFGDAVGEPVADEILSALRRARPKGDVGPSPTSSPATRRVTRSAQPWRSSSSTARHA